MPPRAAARSRVAQTSSSSASTSSSRTKGITKGVASQSRPRKQQSSSSHAEDDSETVGLSGPIQMDDDEEDELGLRSPVKIVEAPSVKSASSKLGSTSVKAKAVFGNARGANQHVEVSEWDDDVDTQKPDDTKPSSRSAKAKTMRARGKAAARPRARASATRTRTRKPRALVASSDEDFEDEEEEEEENIVDQQAAKVAEKRSAAGVSMPEEQIEHFLHGYDLDAANRLDRLRNHLTVSLESARSQMSILLSRLPMAARSLSLKEFLELHQADVNRVVGGIEAAMGSEKNDADGWEELKRKRIRDKQEGEEAEKEKTRREKSARRNGTVSSPAKPTSLTRKASTKPSDKGNPPLTSRPIASSGPPAPCSATFSPRINSTARMLSEITLASKTPARPPSAAGRTSRLAKMGEQIQMYSLNGSPITGFIGPDGKLRYLPRAGLVGEEGEEEEDGGIVDGAATTLPPIKQPLEKKSSMSSIKHAQAANALASILPKTSDTSSSRQLPSSPAPPQRSSALSSSLGGLRFDDDPPSLQQSSPIRPSSRTGGHFTSSLGMGLGLADDSDELPDEEAYMKEIFAQEERKRLEAADRATAKSGNVLHHKGSASRLMAKLTGHGGSSSASSNPPSSPAPSSSSYSARSRGFHSSSPSKAPQSSRGGSLMRSSTTKPTPSNKAVAPPLSSASVGRGGKQRLSLINARGEVVPIEDIREEDVPVEQKAQLARMFQRLGMGFGLGGGGGNGGSPKKR